MLSRCKYTRRDTTLPQRLSKLITRTNVAWSLWHPQACIGSQSGRCRKECFLCERSSFLSDERELGAQDNGFCQMRALGMWWHTSESNDAQRHFAH